MRAPVPALNDPTPDPPEGSIRVVLPEGGATGSGAGHRLESTFLIAACSDGLVTETAGGALAPGLARSWSVVGEEGGGRCWEFVLRNDISASDGKPFTARSMVDHWERRLASGDELLAGLLSPVAGLESFLEGGAGRVAGLQDSQGRLRICTDDPVRGLDLRIAQVGAWPAPGIGIGPFLLREDSAGAVASDRYPGGTGLRGFRWVDAGSADPAYLLVTGEADLAVVYGRSVSILDNAGDGRFSRRRLPSWDLTYALWINPQARWVNDPTFRRWLDGTVDRAALLEFLFEGRGRPAAALLAPGAIPAAARQPASARPFSRGSRPRLTLWYDGSDRYADIIASRLRAAMEPEGVLLELTSARGDDIRFGPEDRSPSMILIAHQPPTSDPVLALLHTMGGLGASASAPLEALDSAFAAADPEARRTLAGLVEEDLLSDYRLVPLFRLDAWLAQRDGLEGIVAGPAGILRLERAGWREESR